MTIQYPQKYLLHQNMQNIIIRVQEDKIPKKTNEPLINKITIIIF